MKKFEMQLEEFLNLTPKQRIQLKNEYGKKDKSGSFRSPVISTMNRLVKKDEMKFCRTCGKLKPFGSFYKNPNKSKQGFFYQSNCMSCEEQRSWNDLKGRAPRNSKAATQTVNKYKSQKTLKDWFRRTFITKKEGLKTRRSVKPTIKKVNRNPFKRVLPFLFSKKAVYVVRNTALWDGTKFGVASDPSRRLGEYNSYDPYKRFEMTVVVPPTVHHKEIEDRLKKDFSIETIKGTKEWTVADYDYMINYIKQIS